MEMFVVKVALDNEYEDEDETEERCITLYSSSILVFLEIDFRTGPLRFIPSFRK
jgi:hypothetical protein